MPRSRDFLGRVARKGPLSLGTAVLLAALGAGCAAPRRAPLALDLVHADAAGTGELRPDPPQQQLPDPDAGYRAEFFAAKGVYLSGRGHWSVLGGDFDGDTTLVGPDQIDIPDADDGFGYELALGWISEGWATEISYTEIVYDGTLGALESEVEYYAVTWNVLRYIRGNESVQPYFVFGLLYSWAELEDASTLGLARGDAELSDGFGIDAGLGLAWWLGPHLALDVRALSVFQAFGEAEGVANNSESVGDGVEGPSFGLSVGLTWVLGNPGSDEP